MMAVAAGDILAVAAGDILAVAAGDILPIGKEAECSDEENHADDADRHVPVWGGVGPDLLGDAGKPGKLDLLLHR
jgi:hypothetical protein